MRRLRMRGCETLIIVLTHLQHDRRCDDCNEHKELAHINGHCFSDIQFWAIFQQSTCHEYRRFPGSVVEVDDSPLTPKSHRPSATKERGIGHSRCVSA